MMQQHCILDLSVMQKIAERRRALKYRVVQKNEATVFDCSYLQNVWTNLCDFWQTL